ncbi:ATP-binding cassette domain-containing protein [Rhodococcus rhodnii]|uniref:Fe(3+) enterobactin transport ATP-binding protein n=2 Tax=Rhodococcus rhodnii TaxID=38312 RepID=R7WN91_9NOCA|nr:ATP-binding cassette domain-containing protein [Rhodococcus rhodnii]EOM75474.1 Fe(3+) enterobactin transport ATP-binding protein [Rhodococcus rhodnii LMG 5362]TXG90506.1 ATP-binding cassette domain-containing protein [Rhodococcus rhodnii]
MIELDGVRKDYSTDVAIGPVNLQIPAGGITALVGPNGAGKSTLLTMIGRLMGADAGTIEIAGHDVTRTPSKDLARIVSILRQENHFVTRLTVRQLVGFGRFPYSKGRITRADEAIVTEAIEFFGLSDLQHRYLDQLSGGQRQRAYVAMVLCQQTDYVLLDEPLNNLDMLHSVQMMQHLRRAADELGRTIVIVLHDINFAAQYADRICAVKDGKVVEFGTPEEIVVDEVLTRVFDTPVTCIDSPHGPLAVYYRPVAAELESEPAG